MKKRPNGKSKYCFQVTFKQGSNKFVGVSKLLQDFNKENVYEQSQYMLNQNGNLYYNWTNKKYVSKIDNNSVIWVLLDMDKGSLKFIINGVDKGEAIRTDDLKSGEFYLTLNMISKNDKIEVAIPQIK